MLDTWRLIIWFKEEMTFQFCHPEHSFSGNGPTWSIVAYLFFFFIPGGSIANIEAVWSSRNMKFYPLSLQDAVMAEAQLARAKTFKVNVPAQPYPQPGGDNPFVQVELQNCSVWQLLNLDVDDACRFVIAPLVNILSYEFISNPTHHVNIPCARKLEKCMYPPGKEKIIFFLGAQPGDKNFLQTNGVFLC